MKVLLTGANGQLGRAIQNEYGNEAEFIRTDMIDDPSLVRLDISDANAVEACVKDTAPDVIINCAAFTNVDGCETNEALAYEANAIGPRNLAYVSAQAGIRLVHISTDYVFAGDASRPYTESDLPHPVSAYGRTKLAGEHFVEKYAKDYYILRTAWLYGDGKNFVKTMLRLSETHDEVSVVCDQKGSPTSASELAKMIRFLLQGTDYGIYHATCEGDTNWADFTETIFRLAGRSTRVRHVTSEEYAAMNPASAKRPKYSILDNAHLRDVGGFSMANWQDALEEYLRNIS